MKCPVCSNTLQKVTVADITVDVCKGGCGGFWLDCGELGKIRSLFKSEEQRNEAARQYFSEIFDNQLAAMKAEGEDKLEKAQKIAKIFRFVCPSNYIPGKQDWGAF